MNVFRAAKGHQRMNVLKVNASVDIIVITHGRMTAAIGAVKNLEKRYHDHN
jgi:transcriptional regulatory protein LevR